VLDVGKGYYVRALARDFALALGTVGHLTALRRTRSGAFVCEEALPIETSRDELLTRIVPLSLAASRALPVARLTEAGARDARHGRPVHREDLLTDSQGPSAWIDPCGDLVAVGEVDEAGCGKVTRGFGVSVS
jgi:tRNA pseudouridine55 synthase